MRRTLVAALLILLAGCSKKSSESPATATEQASREPVTAPPPSESPKEAGAGSPQQSPVAAERNSTPPPPPAESPLEQQRLYGSSSARNSSEPVRRKRIDSSHGLVTASASDASAGPAPPASAVTWNTWAEDAGSPFRPVTHLHPDSDYQLVLDLSAISYGLSPGNGRSRRVGPEFEHRIGDWLKDVNHQNAIFKVLILPDPGYFDNLSQPTERVKTLSFKLSKLNQPDLLLADVDGDPFATLRAKSEPSFRIGHVAFSLHTRSREGMAGIGLSFWADGRPVDELTVQYCVSAVEATARCRPSTHGTVSLNGLDSVRIAAGASDAAGRMPDAAIHFLQLDSDQVIGIFRRKTWEPGRFESWRVGRTAGGLREYFENSLLPAFSKTTTDQGLRERGYEFYNLLFPPPGPSDSPEAGRARNEFEAFVRSHFSDHTASDREHLDTPSIFIRMLPQDNSAIPLIPLGLLAVKLDQGPPEFLGFHFRIEAPLSVQNYQSAAACISTWALVVPPSRGDLQQLRQRFDEGLPGLKNGAQYFYESMADFGTYLADGSESDPAALVVLSHHNRNQISFSSSDMLLSTAIRRNFLQPSLAILDGCGTGAPGAVDFIQQLNIRGVNSVIATNTEIRPEIAADFLQCLASELEDHKNAPEYRLSYAYLNALECLSKRSLQAGEPNYGALALSYSLLGNGNLKLCGPQKKPQ